MIKIIKTSELRLVAGSSTNINLKDNISLSLSLLNKDYQFLRTYAYYTGGMFMYDSNSKIPHIQDEFGAARKASGY